MSTEGIAQTPGAAGSTPDLAIEPEDPASAPSVMTCILQTLRDFACRMARTGCCQTCSIVPAFFAFDLLRPDRRMTAMVDLLARRPKGPP